MYYLLVKRKYGSGIAQDEAHVYF